MEIFGKSVFFVKLQFYTIFDTTIVSVKFSVKTVKLFAKTVNQLKKHGI